MIIKLSETSRVLYFPPVNFVIASDQRERGDPKSFGLSRLLRRLRLLAMTENKRFSKIDWWQVSYMITLAIFVKYV